MFKREGPFSYSFDVMHLLSKKEIFGRTEFRLDSILGDLRIDGSGFDSK